MRSALLLGLTVVAATVAGPAHADGLRCGRDPVDGLIGLAPGVGDAIGLALSSYIVMEAWRMGVPPQILVRMIANIVVDSAVGAVPIAGDLFDFVWKANRRNVDLLLRHGRGTKL